MTQLYNNKTENKVNYLKSLKVAIQLIRIKLSLQKIYHLMLYLHPRRKIFRKGVQGDRFQQVTPVIIMLITL